MDPITGAVVALVFWFIIGSIGWAAIYLGSASIGVFIGDETGGLIGAIIGWILGAAWWVFAIIQTILQVIHLVQLLGVGG
jgi:hypothetical protein